MDAIGELTKTRPGGFSLALYPSVRNCTPFFLRRSSLCPVRALWVSAIAAYFVVFVQFSTLNNDLYRIQNTSRYGPSRYLPETQHIGSESILGTGARPLYLTLPLGIGPGPKIPF